MAENSGAGAEPITIKKYANRRLYNTQSSSYVTLDYLAQMIKDGTDFVVYDAKTGEDITRSVLTHIIVEEEAKGQSLLPLGFLRHLISFYGDSLQSLVPSYLEQSMQSFAHNQEQMRHYMRDAFGGMNPFAQFEDMGRKNMALFENAMKMFAPDLERGAKPEGGGKGDKPARTSSPVGGEQSKSDVAEMRAKLTEMQKQLDALAGKK
ncbi:polyhydroxyalkanoate synthesis repressor PhaR [Varunaivibrio sulfuroxidans]|uniref:Polyhydroxyalkanoate synthesis repressor PhaR n=1 Tax=Varunaivibrio sulfuroxidans TaxID=1773489 RepID=A0A4R3J9N2_9PROT|nr:polyhydroxyalkanoate synthesis repressor PhaR [Varunaivibrio sulfuroxidans]TCS61716.1 polyhydroxyalkanoate synthesis repressor PhaR [Varunaivibrio sulfuroxidans]WES32099.1 polyhydroxyalkanoate synthesis repressor PhaR [Varunaivibrio sulfuroxidans]